MIIMMTVTTMTRVLKKQVLWQKRGGGIIIPSGGGVGLHGKRRVERESEAGRRSGGHG